MKAFEKQVQIDTEDYFSKSERNKKHLEEYNELDYTLGSYLKGDLFAKKIVRKTNYNFFCIEKKPKWIREIYTSEYLKFLEGLLLDFNNVSNKYVLQYKKVNLKQNLILINF